MISGITDGEITDEICMGVLVFLLFSIFKDGPHE